MLRQGHPVESRAAHESADEPQFPRNNQLVRCPIAIQRQPAENIVDDNDISGLFMVEERDKIAICFTQPFTYWSSRFPTGSERQVCQFMQCSRSVVRIFSIKASFQVDRHVADFKGVDRIFFVGRISQIVNVVI